MTASKNTYTSLRARLMIERILAALAQESMTGAQLAAKLHRDPVGVVRYIRHLKESPRRVYTCDHRPANVQGGYAPIYALGNKPDAPVPRRSAGDRYRDMQKDPERYQAYLAKRREIDRAKRVSLPPESKRRNSGPRQHPTLTKQVEILIEQRPGLTTGQLASLVGIGSSSVSNLAQRLLRDGKVRTFTTAKSKRLRWESLSRPPAKWEAPKVVRQSAFSALFVVAEQGRAQC